MADLSLLLDWLALLIIALMSTTVGIYAISVSFLGRAANKVRQDRDRKLKELSNALEEKSKSLKSGAPLDALEADIKKYKDQQSQLEVKLSTLSVRGAAILPLTFFSIGLLFDSIALLLYIGLIPSSLALAATDVYAYASGVLVILGAAFLVRTLYAIDKAATGPQSLVEFRISFENGSNTERFPHSQQQTPIVVIHQWGGEMAENVSVQMYFSDDFQLQPYPAQSPAPQPQQQPQLQVGQALALPQFTPYVLGKQHAIAYKMMNYPGRTTVYSGATELNEDMVLILQLGLVTPSKPGTYKVPVFIWEKKIGKSVYELIFEIS